MLLKDFSKSAETPASRTKSWASMAISFYLTKDITIANIQRFKHGYERDSELKRYSLGNSDWPHDFHLAVVVFSPDERYNPGTILK